MRVTKTELLDNVRKNTKIKFTKEEIADVFDTTMTEIKDALIAGNEINLPNVGILKVKIQAARTARNPKTGEDINVPEHAVVKFRATRQLVLAVAEIDVDNFRNGNNDEEPKKPARQSKAKDDKEAKAQTKTKTKTKAKA